MDEPDDWYREMIEELLETTEVGKVIQICRDYRRCQSREFGPCCAEVTIQYGMTVEDVLGAAKVYRA